MLRRKYYDLFSKFYDKFIKLHSGDKQERLRKFFIKTAELTGDCNVLDICCGTGSTTYYISEKLDGTGGIVVGADFSFGMVKKAVKKCNSNNFIITDVNALPFKNKVFHRVTCTFAFYELKGNKVDEALNEIKRVLVKDGKFLMMEHEIPRNFFIRILFYLRMLSMGFKKAVNILKREDEIFKRHFKIVEKVVSPSKNSKIWICS